MRLAPVAPTVPHPLAYGLLALLLAGCAGEHTDTVAPDDTDTPVDTDPVAPTDEVCDGVDNDQNGQVDDVTFLAAPDADGDGWPATHDTVEVSCAELAAGYTLNVHRVLDCDDHNPAFNPGMYDDKQVCDGLDNNCDGVVADDRQVAVDADGDQWGSPTERVARCPEPPQWTELYRATDCDEGDPATHPGADDDPNVCDGVDSDCSGSAAEDRQVAVDADGDHWGSPTLRVARCPEPPRWTETSRALDCDDTDATIHPDAEDRPDVCDSLDNDCDGDVADQALWALDVDGDGVPAARDGGPVCEAPDGAVPVPARDDCAPDDPEVFPGQVDLCVEDRNCDGKITGTWPVDLDGDGYTVDLSECDPALLATASLGEDCDDENADVYPDAPERCDGVYNDCPAASIRFRAEFVDGRLCKYTDSDGDGLGRREGAPEGTGVDNYLDLDDTRYDPVSPGCPAFSGIRGPDTHWLGGQAAEGWVEGLVTEGGVTRLDIVSGECGGLWNEKASYECRDGALWLTGRHEETYRWVEDGAQSYYELESGTRFTYAPPLLVLPPDDAWGQTFNLETTRTACVLDAPWTADSPCLETTTSTRAYTVSATEGPEPSPDDWPFYTLGGASTYVRVTNTGDDDWMLGSWGGRWYLWGKKYTAIDPTCLYGYAY